MTDEEFDRALVAAGFARIAQAGWHDFTVPAAANAAGLDLARARLRMPTRQALLLTFGALADAAALNGPDDGAASAQERLFDRLMRRIDVLQAHRAGVLALLAALPSDPLTALMLAAASLGSMRWLLEASAIQAGGPLGTLRANGLLGVWVWTVRSWQRDDSTDLAPTMAALDTALARAAQLARSLPGAKDLT